MEGEKRMDLNLTLKQTQTLSPQMLQSMEILQMGSQELLEYIQEQVQENPVLELDSPPQPESENAVLRRKLEWLESTDAQNRHYHRQDADSDALDPISNYGNTEEEDLYRYVASQLEALDLPPALRGDAILLVESLDRNGWLDEPLTTLASEWDRPVEALEKALALVQTLEPAGVGARDLSECLVLQLTRRHGSPLALRIAAHYLEEVGKSHYGAIAKATGESAEAVRLACDEIRALDPRPGSGFAARENLIYINPDLIVVNFPDHFELLTNDYFFPTLSVSTYYCRLLQESDDPQVQTYLTNKVRQAKWVTKSIEQRRGTLLKCAQEILDLQEDFFRRGRGHLRPMSLADIAARVGLHESTVSRAIRDKYIQCTHGVYPLGYFFSRGLSAQAGQEGASPDQAKSLLKALIDGEDKAKPLSDQKLCQMMEAQGCPISRRTVAKYRDELRIPCTTARRREPGKE